MNALLKKLIVTFRPLSEADLETILNIEKASYDFPWTLDILQDCLQSYDYCWVMLQNNQICGYGIMSITAYKAHLLNLCIQPNLRNNGLGMQMLTHLTKLAITHHAEVIFLEVRPSNQNALAIYEKSGFSIIGSRKDYYPTASGHEDALVFAKNLINVDSNIAQKNII
ncbi:Ribosomal-protein-S18p-alanine acetyltransferase [uncultured Candidatus Thioglobus sp.]|nr:Ribosomal-protein-S18p-alanine acetyltransferase [uncultured Candidatus Thioglobus sp.]